MIVIKRLFCVFSLIIRLQFSNNKYVADIVSADFNKWVFNSFFCENKNL